jgi:hypothetical protein
LELGELKDDSTKDEYMFGISFSPDGRRIAAHTHALLRIWSIPETAPVSNSVLDGTRAVESDPVIPPRTPRPNPGSKSVSTRAEKILGLADIVGGGNGLGTGIVGHGINPATGTMTVNFDGRKHIIGNGKYNKLNFLKYVDGVFIPHGVTQLSSDPAMKYSFSTDNKAFDAIENGPNGLGSDSSRFRTIAGVDYSIGGRTMIGFHSSKGITFDLDSIRASNPGESPMLFTAVVGNDFSDPRVPGMGDSDFGVFVDGVPRARFTGMNTGTAYHVNVALSSGDRFLTLVSTCGPSGSFYADRVIVGNPQLTLQEESGAR